MDDGLYDEFGNYIGPELDSEEESGEETTNLEHDELITEEATFHEESETPQNVLDFRSLVKSVDVSKAQKTIVLHEDKKYYPSALEVYGEDVETLVQEEDTQPITEPIIAPIRVKSTAAQMENLPT
eukprot:Sdes_comp9393_c0_seq1m854